MCSKALSVCSAVSEGETLIWIPEPLVSVRATDRMIRDTSEKTEIDRADKERQPFSQLEISLYLFSKQVLTGAVL